MAAPPFSAQFTVSSLHTLSPLSLSHTHTPHPPPPHLHPLVRVCVHLCVRYEEHKLVARVLNVIAEHDPSTPLFINYDSHIVHSPLQVPQEFFDKFLFIENSTVPDWDYHRHLCESLSWRP